MFFWFGYEEEHRLSFHQVASTQAQGMTSRLLEVVQVVQVVQVGVFLLEHYSYLLLWNDLGIHLPGARGIN